MKIMKKLMLCLLAFTGLNANVALAEETSVPEFATIFQLSTKDQSSVAAAFTKFAQSDCRKNLPTAIRVMNENYNGADETTHSVIWNFADAADMSSTFGALRECRAWADTFNTLSKSVEWQSQQLVRTLATGGDYTKDTVYTVWQTNVSDEAAYVKAYKKLMAAQTKNGLVNGAWGLWRVQGGATSEVTHIAFAGAANLETLLATSNPSKAFLTFQREVAGIRSVHTMNINIVLADL
jgi:hypothetical protein